MKIYLIRHGETDYNKRKLFYGATDVPLNQTGVNQAVALREKLAWLPVNLPVFTSKLLRAVETAELVFPDQKKIGLSSFNEKDFGCWEGLTADEIAEKYPEEWQSWLENPFEVTPPAAESFVHFRQRVLKGFDQLLQDNQDVVLVAHGGVLRVVVQACFPEKDFWEIDITQGNYTVLQFQQGRFFMVHNEDEETAY